MAIKYIYEFLDIQHIIARLQDVDKLKAVLLDKKQRKIFDTIPKQSIRNKPKTKKSFTFSVVDMAKSNKKNIPWNLKSEKYKFIFNDDPVNQRLVQLMDPNTKRQLKNQKADETGSFFFFLGFSLFLDYFVKF